MSWSFRIGRIAGIDVYVHFTFFLLLAWAAVQYYLPTRDVTAALIGIAFILTLFGIVVLHELGHALAARRYGIRTRDITLLPIGGVARLERIPEEPRQELVVALAGPAVNLVLAAGIYLGVQLQQGLLPVEETMRVGSSFLNQIFWVNLSLALFNLLPAFPMDGGRVLRALLAMRMDYVRATQIAATVGQAMAILFAFAGLFYNPFLIFIALMVWMGASQEASMVQIRAALAGIPVARTMITDFRTLRPEDTLQVALQYAVAGFQQDFPVVDDSGRLVGVVTHEDLASALGRYGAEVPVAEVMRREFITATPGEMLSNVFVRLQEHGCRTIPVVEGGRLVGILTADKLAEVLMIREAMLERPGRAEQVPGPGWSTRARGSFARSAS